MFWIQVCQSGVERGLVITRKYISQYYQVVCKIWV